MTPIRTTLEGRDGRVVPIGFAHPFVVIGERLNPTNRKALAQQLLAGEMALVRRDARAQVEAGAAVLDVNVGLAGVDEARLMPQVVRAVMEEVDVPLCIDSANPATVAAGLQAFADMGGRKALVNSTTAEADRLESLLPLAARYGAAIIGLAHDERGIGYEVAARVEAAARIIARAAELGVPRADVLVDCLTLTVAADGRAGWAALETQRRVWIELGVNTTAGASNVSFGLPDRPRINLAYLPLMISRGLTTAIANPLDPETMRMVMACDVILGRDELGMNWVRAFRKAQRAREQGAPRPNA